jgi:tetratricopeptide (TPR) repeat protein
MSRGTGLLAVLLVLSAAACSRPPAPPPAAESPRSFADLAAEGDQHLAARAWDRAVRAYEAALALDPASGHVRYRLGVAYAALGRRDDAARAFEWVLDHVAPDRDEARLARQWLEEAGLRPGAPRAEVVAERADEPPARGQVQGRTEWRDLDPDRPVPNLQILLVGEEGEARGRRYGTRARLNEPYRFERVAPGRYRLMAQVGPVRLWDTFVSVPETGTATLDLTPATAVAPADALRPRRD